MDVFDKEHGHGFTRYYEQRKPVGYVVLAGPSPKLPSGDREAYGPFESEDDAVLWLSEYLPERVLFTIFPLFDTINS